MTKEKNFRRALSFYLISQSRQLLMGIAILGVLIGHWFSLSEHPTENIILRAINFFTQLVFTQGFLLLSGFGLFYSFSRNGEVAAFYQKRFTRLIIPFAIIIFPFLIFYTIVGDINGWQFIGRLTSVSYWFDGNYYGMWYIALSVVLYLLYPVLHKIMMYKDSFGVVTTGSLLMMLLFVGATRSVQNLAPEYYQEHIHTFNGAFMFVVGMYVAYLSKQQKFRQQCGG